MLAKLISAVAAALALAAPAAAIKPVTKPQVVAPPTAALATRPAAPPIAAVSMPTPNRTDMQVLVGRSQIVRLASAATRVAISDPRVADYVLVSPKQVYVYGKTVGLTNMLIWNNDDLLRQVDITVDIDLSELRRNLRELLPREKDIVVKSVGGSIVLTGTASDVIVADQAVSFADAYARNIGRTVLNGAIPGAGDAGQGNGGGGNSVKVINTMRIRDPQQVMLEVRIAEISKNLLQSLGSNFDGGGKAGDVSWKISSSFLNAGSPLAELLVRGRGVGIDAEKDRGVFKILAEPTIIAISGEEASFLAGGRLLLPVNQGGNAGAGAVTLQERDFGVGLKFKPTVLDDGRISLKVSPEVTEFNTTAVQVQGANGVSTSSIPSFTLRRVSTTVQMRDNQSLVIAGLLKDNVKNSVKQIPLLGDIPILGTLFRSVSYQADLTELVVVVTPRLVRATEAPPKLPTDNYRPPSERELFREGKLEGETR